MQKIFLVCGVPGSGKSWVCEQLKARFDYVAHDDYIQGDYTKGLVYHSKHSEKPVLGDCPFGERVLVDALRKEGANVEPVFIFEDARIIKKRYEARDSKPIPPQHITRAINIKKRAESWHCFFGTSSEVLEHLKEAA